MIFRHPVKKDFHGFIENELKNKNNADELASKIFEFKERLPFTRTIESIGRQKIKNKINNLKKLSPEVIFESILDLASEEKGKSISGAKFPVHPKDSDYLMKNYGKSKVLFLTRDPRAIFISDFKKKERESKGKYYRFPVKGILLRKLILLYASREWKRSLKNYELCNNKYGNERIKLFFYENIIQQKEKLIQQISGFIHQPEDLFDLSEIEIADSSYEKGVSIDRWENEITNFEILLIKLLAGRKMKKYGYR